MVFTIVIVLCLITVLAVYFCTVHNKSPHLHPPSPPKCDTAPTVVLLGPVAIKIYIVFS